MHWRFAYPQQSAVVNWHNLLCRYSCCVVLPQNLRIQSIRHLAQCRNEHTGLRDHLSALHLPYVRTVYELDGCFVVRQKGVCLQQWWQKVIKFSEAPSNWQTRLLHVNNAWRQPPASKQQINKWAELEPAKWRHN